MIIDVSSSSVGVDREDKFTQYREAGLARYWIIDPSLKTIETWKLEAKRALAEFRDFQDATSRFTLAALLLNNDHVASTIRSELRKVVDVLVDADAILKVLREEVIKRDVLEGVNAERATRQVKKKAARPLKPSNGWDPPQEKPEPGNGGDCPASVQS